MSDEKRTDVIQKFLLGLVSLAIVALVGLTINLDRRVGSIEASRFNTADAAAMERRIIQGTPPAWLLSRLDAMERRIDARFENLDAAIAALRSIDR